jgi:parvulin-like peptidyl-prolyl isomerase
MKFKLGWFLLLLLIPALPASSDATEAYSDKIAAVVNGDMILMSEIEKYKNTPTMVSMYRNLNLGIIPPGKSPTHRELLEELIVIRLLEQEASKTGVTVPKQAALQQLAGMKQRTGITQDEFVLSMAVEGLTLSDWLELIGRQFTIGKLISQQIGQKVFVLESEAQKYFKEHQNEIEAEYKKLMEEKPAAPQLPEEPEPNIPTHIEVQVGGKLKLRQIVLTMPESPSRAAQEKVVKKFRKIQQEVLTGADFGKLAKKYSQGPYRASGGDLGWVPYSDMAKMMQKMMQHTRVGHMTRPLTAKNSIIVFFLEDAKGRKTEKVPLPEKERKALEEQWKKSREEYKKRMAERNRGRKAGRGDRAKRNQADADMKKESTEVKALGILNEEEEKEYMKARDKVHLICRMNKFRARMKAWIEELKKKSVIEVKI